MRARIVVLFAFALGSRGVAQEPLTLRAAVQLSLASHPSLRQAESVIARAEAARREQQASLLPALHADATLTRFEQPMVVAPLHGFDARNPPQFDRTLMQGALTLGYTVWDGGARGARLTRASAQLEAAHAADDAARASLIAETVRRYSALLTVQQQLIAHDAAVRALTTEQARVAQLFQQGRVARVAQLRAEAALSRARAEQSVAQAQLAVAETDLARVTGLTPLELRARTLTFRPDSARVPSSSDTRESVIARAHAQHPEVRRLRAQLTAASAGEAEARSSWWPRVLLGSRYVHYGSGEGDAGGEWQGGLQLNYALFTAGARPAAQDRAHAERLQAEAELALLELRLTEQVDRAHAELSNARARVQALTAAVEQYAEVARIEKLALDTGAGVQSDYLFAETELLRARAAQSEARYAELMALVELTRATGELTMAWIDNLETSR